MAADGGDSASFTVRLVNQVMAPARQIKAAMGDVEKAFKATQKTMSAPAPRRGALSDWDKMVGGAKRSQASDFAKQHLANIKQQNAALKNQEALKQRMAQHHADHALGASALNAAGDAVAGSVAYVAAAALAAAAAVGYMTYKFGEASIEGAAFAEKSQMAIGFLTDSAGQGAREFESVRNMAQSLGLQVDETVHSFQRLLASQFEVGQSKSLIKMAADMQAIGASGEEVQRILYALDEVKSIGTLQKRQERMLMMAGISGQLIDQALMKRMGLSSIEKVHAARKGNKIEADTAIEAIKDAVMHKVHEDKLGQTGAAFANTTLTGMTNQAHAAIENFFISVGEAILPSVTKIIGHIRDTVTALANDPKIAELGTFLLSELEIFTLWVDANWPQITNLLVAGAHLTADAIRMVVECFDDTTIKGKIVEGVLVTIAVALGLVAAAAFLVMLPIYAFIAIIGLVVYAIIEAVEWIGSKIKALAEYLGLSSGTSGATNGGAVTPATAGVGPWANLTTGLTPAANDNSIQGVTASGGAQALNTMNTSTESGQERGGAPVHIGELNVTVPQAEDPQHQAQLIAQSVHTEVAKLIRQAS